MTFAFNGPEADQGMGLEPEGMIAFEIIPGEFRVMLEYYTALGPTHHLRARTQQTQMLYPKLEYVFSQFFVINAGFGEGLTFSS